MEKKPKGKGWEHMGQDRVRIADIAESPGLSTATVSNVIHGKTEKVSEETVRRVQQELERTGYIPNMAGILLARNDSRILGVVVHDHPKYEGRVLEDGFVMSSLNALCREVNRRGLPGRGLFAQSGPPDGFVHCGQSDLYGQRADRWLPPGLCPGEDPILADPRHQDPGLRAKTAIDCLEALNQGCPCPARITLPVELIIRESTRRLSCLHF